MNWAWNMFEAARQLAVANPTQTPFLLFIASNAGNAGDISAWGDGQPFMYSLLRAFYNHPNYYKIGGKLVVGAFIGSTNDADWANVFTLLQNNQGVGVYYCPTLQDSSNADLGGNTFNAFAQQWVGSVSYWTGGGPAGDISATNQLAAINRANKPWAAVTYSGSNYWSTISNYYFEHFGGEGPRDEWLNIINMNPAPAFVMETTWNDFTESYATPADPANILYAGYNVQAILKPHKGYAELRKYYAQWYTTGVQPTITKDLVIYFYRTSAAALNSATNGLAGVPDVIFLTTQLTAPATLHVSTGGQITDIALPAGINYSRVPFAVGAQQFSLVRNGVTIASVTGQNVLGSISATDLEYTTGFVYAA